MKKLILLFIRWLLYKCVNKHFKVILSSRTIIENYFLKLLLRTDQNKFHSIQRHRIWSLIKFERACHWFQIFRWSFENSLAPPYSPYCAIMNLFRSTLRSFNRNLPAPMLIEYSWSIVLKRILRSCRIYWKVPERERKTGGRRKRKRKRESDAIYTTAP